MMGMDMIFKAMGLSPEKVQGIVQMFETALGAHNANQATMLANDRLIMQKLETIEHLIRSQAPGLNVRLEDDALLTKVGLPRQIPEALREDDHNG